METEKKYDLAYLNQVFQGNKQMVNNIISLFLQQIEPYLANLESCLLEKKWLEMSTVANKAKTSTSMIGIRNMGEKILLVEQNSKNLTNLDTIPELLKNLRADYESVAPELQKELAQK